MKRVDALLDLKMRTLTDLIIHSMNLVHFVDNHIPFTESRDIRHAVVYIPSLHEFTSSREEEAIQIYPPGHLFTKGEFFIPSPKWNDFMKQYTFDKTDVSPMVWFRFATPNSVPSHLAIGHTVNKEKTFSSKSATLIDCLIDNMRGLLEHNGYSFNISQVKTALGDYGTSESRR